jgi:teichuronic acid exporter
MTNGSISFRKMFIVLQGAAGAHLIGFFMLPMLTRVLDPAAFGNLQIFQAVLTFAIVLTSLRYEVALLSCTNEEQISVLLRLCNLITIVVSVVTLMFCLTFSFYLQAYYPAIPKEFVFLLPIGVIAAGLMQSWSYYPLWLQDFRTVSTAKIINALAFTLPALSLSVAGSGNISLIIADILGRFFCAAYIVWRSSNLRSILAINVPSGQLKKSALQYRRFPVYSVPSALINAIGSMAMPLFLTLTYSAHDAGQYAIVDRSIGFGVSLVTASASQVFTAEFSKAILENREQPFAMFRDYIRKMLALAVIPMVVLTVWAPDIIRVVFGSNWILAGHMAQILAPMYLISFASQPVNMALVLLGNQRLQMSWEIGRIVAISIGWTLILTNSASVLASVLMYSIVTSIMCIAYLGLAYWRLQNFHISPLENTTGYGH